MASLPLHNPSSWALAACVAAAFSEGIMSGTRIKARFAELQLPKGAPDLWAWSVVGGAYYVLFFFLLRSTLARPPIPFWTSVMLTLTAVLVGPRVGAWKEDLRAAMPFLREACSHRTRGLGRVMLTAPEEAAL